MPKAVALVLTLLAGTAAVAHAQALQAVLIAQNLSHPVAFVQDPSDLTVQMIVQQNGHIRVLRNGAIQPADFLDLSGATLEASEQGLLGLAFPADYATSRRFYVCFVNNISGGSNVIVSRFLRSAGDPLRADPSTRFDLRWPDGNRYITHPFTNHNGGNMAFGPDGYLYIGNGDGGAGGDPNNYAQNPMSLLGKMLRLNVSGVSLSDPQGYAIPPDNPYAGRGDVLNEIWAVGLRNPWRWSFDDPAHGGTGALVIGDVGQNAWEEVNYVPAGSPGRNYGWRVREGRHDYDLSQPVFSPVTEPIHEYSHAGNNCSVTGGFVYRGSALGSAINGRYFFADYCSGHVWSLGLSISQINGEASVVNILDHTSELGAGAGAISSFGVDAAGELYTLNYATGRVYRITTVDGPSDVRAVIDTPTGGTVTQPVAVQGWAIDLGSGASPGVDTVHVWAVPTNGSPAMFLGASSGLSRPDVASAFGGRFLQSGFSVPATSLPRGSYTFVVYPRSSVTHTFAPAQVTTATIVGRPRMNIDFPGSLQTWVGRAAMGGWALDLDTITGTGVSAVQIWARRAGEANRFVGNATMNLFRPDVQQAFGPQYPAVTGWFAIAGGLPPGTWSLTATALGMANEPMLSQSVDVILLDGLRLQIDLPSAHATLGTGTNVLAGWALDVGAVSGTGVNAIHVWAVPTSGSPPTFLGEATLGLSRPDVGAAFGGQFNNAGYVRAFNLPPGTYDLVAYALRGSTGTFDLATVVRVTIN